MAMAEDMEWEDSQVDEGAYHQISILHLLRNGFTPALAAIAVRQFKNTRVVRKKDEMYESNKDKTIYDFLKRINNKGKKEETKRNKRVIEPRNDQSSRTLHLSNVNDYEEDLKIFKTIDFVTEEKESELINCFSSFDATFLLNLITNELIDYELNKDILLAVNSIKSIRNQVFHCGRKSDYEEFLRKFEELCEKLKDLYLFLQWDTTMLQEKINQAEEAKEAFNRPSTKDQMILREMCDELKEEEKSKYCSGWQDSCIAVPMKDARKGKNIEDFEKFLEDVQQPVVLCGPSGSGKSTALHKLNYKFCFGEYNKYALVIMLDNAKRLNCWSSNNIFNEVRRKIRKSCPKTVGKYTIDMCFFVLMNCKNILFLVNCNVNSEVVRGDRFEGKWVFCSNRLPTDWKQCYNAVDIEPLNETSKLEMLSNLLPTQDALALYDGCDYKRLISTPEMVKLFSETREQKFVTKLFQAYLEEKMMPIKNSKIQCQVLEKKTFDFILANRMEYSNDDLCDVSEELRSVLFIKQKNSYVFRYRIIEDFFAAKYIVANPNAACKKWVDQVPLFRRVFKYVCSIWNEVNSLQENLKYLKSFLSKFINGKETFTMWPFLMSVVEYCNFQPDLIALISKLIVEKNVWLIKCKSIDDDKIDALFKILENVQLNQPLLIRIESGVHRRTICEIWDKLSSIPGLYNNATVQIVIKHKQSIMVPSDSSILTLLSKIAKVDKPLFIKKYEGPFLCSQTPDFLKCYCMSQLEILDVTVFDVASLSETLSCENLQSLNEVTIKVELRASECHCIQLHELIFPSLPETVSFDICIRYFDELNFLLEKFKNKENLRDLTIQGMRITENFRLDLSSFTALKALYINFNQHVVYSGQPFKFCMNSKLPETLQRLLLRNTEFWDDSCVFFLERFCTQRLILIDSNVSVEGFRQMLKNHTDASMKDQQNTESVIEGQQLTDENIADAFKRQCTSKDACNTSKVTKNPRLGEGERTMRRKKKPPGKELIITKVKSCSNCQKYPCQCQQLNIHRRDSLEGRYAHSCQLSNGSNSDSLEQVVGLISDAYDYNILSLCYTSEHITVRKDVCGDLRVHCPLADLNDDFMKSEHVESMLYKFLNSLGLAQSITLKCTGLTLIGVRKVIEKIIELKNRMCSTKEPFSLSISSSKYDVVADEIKNSEFLKFIIHQSCLKQFKFCYCYNKSKYIRKAFRGEIFIDDELIKLPT